MPIALRLLCLNGRMAFPLRLNSNPLALSARTSPAEGRDEIHTALVEELALGDGTIELQALEVTRTSRDTAYEIGQYKLHIELVDGAVIEEEGNTLLIWKLGEDNVWRIHVDMWNTSHPDH